MNMLQGSSRPADLAWIPEWTDPPFIDFRKDAYRVAVALQWLVAVALFGSRESLEQEIIEFASEVPTPAGTLESLWLREKLRNECNRVAFTFHRRQDCAGACEMPPVEQYGLLWNSLRISPRIALLRWLATFLLLFDRHHRRIGLPARTARLLRHSWRDHRAMTDVSKRLAVERSVMERGFLDRYGLTPKAYHTRVRVRTAVMALHGSTEKVEYVAHRVGYAAATNFYAALERTTG
jgi:AraC-like DNA-binding protein